MTTGHVRDEADEGPLPRPTGSYAVGFVDIEYEDTEAEERRNILVRIYYPTGLDIDAEPKRRAPWIPSSHYFPSYGYFLKVPSFLFGPFVRLFYGNTRIWAVDEAPIVDANASPSFPVLIFSHGLAGIRTTYSSLCTDLASQGIIVCALEHRDGSACMTLQKGTKQTFQFDPPDHIHVDEEDLRRGGGANPFGQTPQQSASRRHARDAQDARQLKFRQEQLRQRCLEVHTLLRLLRRINEGHMFENLWSKHHKSKKDGDLRESSVWFLKDRIDLADLSLMGHSFGGATMMQFSVEVLAKIPVRSVIAIDPWMYAIRWDLLPPSCQVPLLVVTMEQFHWPENIAQTQKFVEQHALHPQHLYTVRRGSHQQCCDIPLLCPTWGMRYCLRPGSPSSRDVVQCCRRLAHEFWLTRDVRLADYDVLFTVKATERAGAEALPLLMRS